MPQRKQWTVQETKLIPPARRGGLIERGRLMPKAIAGAQGRLLLLLGAAGFGKTSVLACLHRGLSQQGRAVGWISLDESDNDHARFLAHFIELLRVHDARFGAGIAALLGSGAPLPPAILRTGLLNELAALERETYVFLDDYHLISDPEVRQTVNQLLIAPLGKLHLLMASRSRNELPLSRLRALGQVREIEGAELAFSEEETRAFLASACRRELGPAQVRTLHARTEGWAASLQLASIALESVSDVPRFLAGFSGETRDIGEFLGDEVLRRQTPELQQFLLDASVLRRFNAVLAQRVSGRGDARALIDEIEARNLFVYSLDDRRNWYRFHHLFADFLRRRLRDRSPDRVAELHRRAASGLIELGLEAEAIEHAFLAGDTAQAGRLLDGACVSLFASGQVTTLQQHAARLPQAALRHLPRLQLELSWDYEIQWRFADARATLQNVALTLEDQGGVAAKLSGPERTLLESKLLHRQMMLELFTDRRDQALVLCRRWQAEKCVDDPFMQASVGAALMLIQREAYDCEAAPAKAEALRAQFLAGGAIYGTIFHDSVTATTLFMRGEVEAAEALLVRARRCAVDLAGPQAPVTAMPTVLLSELCYERGELSRARDLLAEHVSFSAEFGFLDQTIARFVTASRLAFSAGQLDDAEAAIDAGMYLAGQHGFARLLAHLVAERLRQLSMLGRPREARALLARPDVARWLASPMPGEGPTTTQEMFATAWVRMALLRGDTASALRLLKRWIAHTRQRRCHRATLRLSALLARTHAEASDQNAARRVLRETLGLIPQGGFVRSFIDEGPVLISVVEDLRISLPDSEEALRQQLASILDRAGGGQLLRDPVPAPRGTAAGSECESLSPREIEILRLSAQGMASCDISRATSLSENTIKWYWQRIFTKLGVHRRFDAVKMARQRRWMD